MDDTRDNQLLSVFEGVGLIGLARINLASGTFVLSEIASGLLAHELERINPAEILVSDDFSHTAISNIKCSKKCLAAWQFDYDSAFQTLTKQFNSYDLKGFGLCRYTSCNLCCGCVTKLYKVYTA